MYIGSVILERYNYIQLSHLYPILVLLRSTLLFHIRKSNLQGSDQIPAELIQAGGKTVRSDIQKLILLAVKKNCLIRRRSLYSFNSQKG
jgi:hypothetical protein